VARKATYDRWAEAYRDWWAPVLAPSATGLLDRVGELLPTGELLRVLDIGAGTGTLSLAALERWPAARVVAVDPSRRMLELAEAVARERGVSDRLEVQTAEAARMPLADASVDAAMTSFVIQLVPSRSALLREAFRVLRPGGAFGCLTWLADAEDFAPDVAFEDAADELDIELPDPDADRKPRPYESPDEAGAELRRAGFASVDASEVWLEHAFTPETYVGLLEHWIEDEAFEKLSEPMRQRLREATLRRLQRLAPEALLYRRPLVSVIGIRPQVGA
jgi:SAM-dependent methyltransferase